MSTHPWMHHEIARLRHEERIVRAAAYEAGVPEPGRRRRFEVSWLARRVLGERRRPLAAAGVVRLQS
jgi:hypothetical protein